MGKVIKAWVRFNEDGSLASFYGFEYRGPLKSLAVFKNKDEATADGWDNAVGPVEIHIPDRPAQEGK